MAKPRIARGNIILAAIANDYIRNGGIAVSPRMVRELCGRLPRLGWEIQVASFKVQMPYPFATHHGRVWVSNNGGRFEIRAV